MIQQALQERDSYNSHTAVYVRTNSPTSGLIPDDLKSIVRNGVDGIVIPKVDNTIQLEKIIKIIADLEQQRRIKPIGIMPSIESAEGVVKTYEIASSGGKHSRIDCIIFGVFDLLADMRVEYSAQSDAAKYARARVALDARAARVHAIDAIWQNLSDLKGLEQDCILGKSLGYAGKSVIHPDQIDTVHRMFYPNASEISWARKIVDVYPQSTRQGRGAITIDGKMIDEVHYKQAKAVLDVDNLN